jgi:predicted RNA-binding protein with PIN domain
MIDLTGFGNLSGLGVVMPYLIDGHNLIAQMPGMALADPDDEVQLVLRLRQFAARKKQKIIVVFDHGIPGGWSRDLSTGPVKVVFAGSHSNADRVIMERLRDAKTPTDIKVVSSDGEIQRMAKARRAEVISSQDFVLALFKPPPGAVTRSRRDAREDVRLSKDEVREWLRLFKERK